MASIYPDASGGQIGALLRQIQEDRQNNPVSTPPATEPSNPVRNLVQPALSQVESPESAHVFSAQPELTPGQPGGQAPTLGAPTVVPPVDAAQVVGPVVPAAAPVTPGQPGGQPAPASSVRAVAGASTPSLATRIGVPVSSSGLNVKAAAPAQKPAAPAPAKPVGRTSPVGGLALSSGLLPEAEALGSRVLGKIGGPIVGGFGLANSLLQALTGNSFLNPKKAS